MFDMPCRGFDQLWHLGSLRKADKGHGSYEGAGLSVCRHPDAWRAIAKLGGQPLWKLTRPGNRFLLAHKLTRPMRSQIEAWGLTEDLVRPEQYFRAHFYDEETERWSYFICASRAEAKRELEIYERGRISETTGLAASPRLRRRTRNEGDPVGLYDLLLTVYADDVLKLDGVWWQDRLDVWALSAPRGVIFPRRLRSWTKSKSR